MISVAESRGFSILEERVSAMFSYVKSVSQSDMCVPLQKVPVKWPGSKKASGLVASISSSIPGQAQILWRLHILFGWKVHN